MYNLFAAGDMLFIAGFANFCRDPGLKFYFNSRSFTAIYIHITSTTCELVQDVRS